MLRIQTLFKTTFVKTLLVSGLGIVFLMSLYGYAMDDLHLITYTTSDWLINYQGGFVRRGLIGQLIFLLTTNASNTLWGMFFLQSIIALTTLGLILKIYFICAKSLRWLIFLLSPGFFITYFLYDTHSALRKENLVFLTMALLVIGLSGISIKKTYIYLTMMVYGLAVFSHELACLCLPFLLYPIVMRLSRVQSQRGPLLKLAFVLSMLAGLGIVSSSLFRGNENIVQNVCASLVERGLDQVLCGYSIPFLASNPHEAWGYVIAQVTKLPYIPLYFICLVLGLLPFALTNWIALRSTHLLMAIGALGLLPLFMTGIDWGRWIHIYIVLMTLCLFWYGTQSSIVLKQIPSWGIAIFISAWALPAIILRPDGILTQQVSFLPNLGLIDVAYRKWHEVPKVDPAKQVTTALLPPYEKIIFYPLEKNSQVQHRYLIAALGQLKSTNASLLNGLGTSPYFNFFSQQAIDQENQKVIQDLRRGRMDPTALYVFPKSGVAISELLPALQKSHDGLFYGGEAILLAPNWQKCTKCQVKELPQQYALHRLSPGGIGSPISFSFSRDGKNPLLTMGWHDFAEDWGTWSVGKHAQLVVPIPLGEPKILQLKLRAFILGSPQHQLLNITIDNQANKSFILEKFDENIIELELNTQMRSKEFITLDLEIPNARSPLSIGVSDDRRQLGIGLQSAVFY